MLFQREIDGKGDWFLYKVSLNICRVLRGKSRFLRGLSKRFDGNIKEFCEFLNKSGSINEKN